MTKPTNYSTFPMPARPKAGVAADVNADFMTTGTLLNTPTLYPSAYLVLTSKGYTKHYYAGTERVAARIGSGGLSYDATCVTGNGEVAKRSDKLFWEGLKTLNEHKTKPEDFAGMSLVDARGKEVDWLKKIDLDKLAMSWQLEAKIDPGKIHFIIDDNSYPAMPGNTRYENEPDVYFYHSDHLGGASWITDADGKAVQHLQYLPYGEPYVNQRISGYNERFTFTGKERDEETGYGYFGARYMDYSMMTSFISVDRYASKYPFISPYAYCAWNPIKLTDPNGDTIRPVPGSSPEFIAYLNQAIQYLIDNGADDVYSQLQSNTAIVYVEGISFQDAYDIAYNPASNKIQWCPVAGIYTSEEIMMSPATVLEHEMDHALQTLQNPEQQLVDFATSSDYSNKEEERVITGSEQRTACRLGEISDGQVTRKNHKGRPYEVVSPISTTLKDPSQKLRKPILNVNDLDQVDIIWERK